MKMIFSRLVNAFARQAGQTSALLVIALPVLVGAGALATDVASYYYNAFQMQNAVDAAALSGAKYLPCQWATVASKNDATDEATTIAKADWLKTAELSGQPTFSYTGSGAAPACPGGGAYNDTIKMTVTRNVPFYFGRVVGLNQGTVNVSATAKVSSLGGGPSSDFFPIGIQSCDGSGDPKCPYHLGEDIGTLAGTSQAGGGGWPVTPGNWGPVQLPSSTVSVGSSLTARTGAGNCTGCEKPLAQQLINDYNNGVANYPSDSVTSITPGDPRVVIVPIVNWNGCTGACSLTVLGFASIWINSVNADGTTVNASFVSYTVNGSSSSGGTEDVGTSTPKLTS